MSTALRVGLPHPRPLPPRWARGYSSLRQHGFGFTTLAIVALVVGVPLATGLGMSLHVGLPGRAGPLSFENFGKAYLDPTLLDILWTTLRFAAGTVLVALVFAVPLVWLVHRTDMPGKGAIFVLTIATLLVPVFLGAMGWILLFSPQIGLANALAKTLFGLKDAPFSIYNIPGMAVVQGLSLVPACFFMLGAAFRAMDPALEEASLTAGAGRLKALFTVTLPLAWPAIAAVMVYMFMLAVSLFEVPAIIGWPSRIFVLSSLVYFAVNPSVGLPSYGLAGAYGVLMVGLGVLLAVFYFRIARNTRKYAVVTGRGYRPALLELGVWRWPALGFVGFYSLLALVMPLLALLWTALLPHAEALSMDALHDLTLSNFEAIPQYVGLKPFLNTALLVLLAPTVAVGLSVLVSWVTMRQQFPLRGVLDGLAFMPQAVPHILFAAALAYLALVYRAWLPIYGSVFIIILVDGIAFLAYGSRTLNNAMIQLHQELEESGRVCGSSRLQALRTIVLPLIAGAVFNAWLFICLLSYREVTVALLLRGSNNLVLSTLLWTLWTNGRAEEVGALGVVLIAVTLLIAWAARGLLSRGLQAAHMSS
ncbi:MAG TPA: iron ABC transporter permease [Chloroflexota bacterium]|jgi:iron(III) transport system permease protein